MINRLATFMVVLCLSLTHLAPVQAQDVSEREFQHAYQLLSEGYLDEALAAYQLLILKYPQEQSLYNNMGTIYMARKQYKEAEHFFKKALELNPFYVDALINFGSASAYQDKFEIALQAYEEALRYRPADRSIDYAINLLKNRLSPQAEPVPVNPTLQPVLEADKQPQTYQLETDKVWFDSPWTPFSLSILAPGLGQFNTGVHKDWDWLEFSKGMGYLALGTLLYWQAIEGANRKDPLLNQMLVISGLGVLSLTSAIDGYVSYEEKKP